jgi:hypothetical protein
MVESTAVTKTAHKAKITYYEDSLSALAVNNLARALDSSIKVEKATKPSTRSEFFHVELDIDS